MHGAAAIAPDALVEKKTLASEILSLHTMHSYL
jgi:hypothetical protein